MTMTFDKDVDFPEIVGTLKQVCDFFSKERMDYGKSVFLADFPQEHMASLAAALVTYNVVPIYTQADAVYGGRGVRIYNMGEVKFGTNIRKEGDWTAPRKSNEVWAERIGKWFFNPLEETKFYWNADDKRVEILTEQDDPNPVIPETWFEIAPLTAFIYMCDEGKPYRATKEPLPDKSLDLPEINAWVGVGSVVWNYSVKEDIVKQHPSRADADYAVSAAGINFPHEDAPLVAWLGFNAAKAYTGYTAPEEPTADENPYDI